MTASNRIQSMKLSAGRLNLYSVPFWISFSLLLFTPLATYLDRVSPDVVTYALACGISPIVAGMLAQMVPTRVNDVMAKFAAAGASTVAGLMVCLWLWLRVA